MVLKQLIDILLCYFVICSVEEPLQYSSIQVVMTIPEGFELEPVKAGSHPAPDVPAQQKSDIYDDAESHFKTTDEHAIHVSVSRGIKM